MSRLSTENIRIVESADPANNHLRRPSYAKQLTPIFSGVAEGVGTNVIVWAVKQLEQHVIPDVMS